MRVPFCARQIFGGLRRHTSAGMVPARELIALDDLRPMQERGARMTTVGPDQLRPRRR